MLTIKNHHTTEMPDWVHDHSERSYFGYFENEHGEQWVILIEPWRVRIAGGDIDWKTTTCALNRDGTLALEPDREREEAAEELMRRMGIQLIGAYGTFVRTLMAATDLIFSTDEIEWISACLCAAGPRMRSWNEQDG